MPLAIGLAAISNRRGLGHRQRQPLSTSHFTPWRADPTRRPPPSPAVFGGRRRPGGPHPGPPPDPPRALAQGATPPHRLGGPGEAGKVLGDATLAPCPR